MIRGIYRSAGAMLTEMIRQDIHANNLANANTTGFKRSLGDVVKGGDASGQAWAGRSVDLSPGRLEVTNSPLDVALTSSGYFVLSGPDGPVYTRDGHFTRDAAGCLVSSQGLRVQGEQGDILLTGSQVQITAEGAVVADGQVRGRLRVVNFPPAAALGSQASVQITAHQQPVPVASPGLVQGALETSNVNPIVELGAIRNGYRIYEANARAVTQVDSSLRKLIEAATS